MELKANSLHWDHFSCKNYPLSYHSLADQLVLNQPPYSECAYFGKRSLGILPWLGPLSNCKDSLLDRHNLELSHEHILFGQSGDNIGFERAGSFTEHSKRHNYHLDRTCYDGAIIREAVKLAEQSQPYHLIWNNCQDFAERIRKIYQLLVSRL